MRKSVLVILSVLLLAGFSSSLAAALVMCYKQNENQRLFSERQEQLATLVRNQAATIELLRNDIENIESLKDSCTSMSQRLFGQKIMLENFEQRLPKLKTEESTLLETETASDDQELPSKGPSWIGFLRLGDLTEREIATIDPKAGQVFYRLSPTTIARLELPGSDYENAPMPPDIEEACRERLSLELSKFDLREAYLVESLQEGNVKRFSSENEALEFVKQQKGDHVLEDLGGGEYGVVDMTGFKDEEYAREVADHIKFLDEQLRSATGSMSTDILIVSH